MTLSSISWPALPESDFRSIAIQEQEAVEEHGSGTNFETVEATVSGLPAVRQCWDARDGDERFARCNVIQRSNPYSSTLVNITTKTSRTSSFVKWAFPNRTLILESVPVLTHSKLRKSLNALSPSSSNSSPISSLWLGMLIPRLPFPWRRRLIV